MLSPVLQLLCCFIHHYSLVAIPLTALTSSFPFSGCQPLKSPSRPSIPGYLRPILQLQHPECQPKVEVDACDVGGGCVLRQGASTDQKLLPCAFITLTPVTGTEELQQQLLNAGCQYGTGGVVALARGCQITFHDLG